MSIARLYEYYQQCTAVFIDSRAAVEQALFFAIGQKNEQGYHRGNAFVEQAIESGKAAYAVINDPNLKTKHADDPRYFLVEDSEVTLQELARYHRKQLSLPIIAIAGSNGKTTIKELLQAILSKQYKTFVTQGNLNNHLGVPLSLLAIHAQHEMAVLELGANHLYETKFLAELVLPDYGLVTNCGKDHLGEYGSFEHVVQANKELYDTLAATQKQAFVSKNDTLLVEMSKEVANRQFYGANTSITAEVTARPFLALNLQIEGQVVAVQTQLFGQFWLDTVLGAAAVGTYFKVAPSDIAGAIAAYQPAALRSQQTTWKGNPVLLDCYNANPSSMEVFVDEIQHSTSDTPKVLVLGEMLELGPYSQEEHQNLVDRIDWAQYAAVVFIGASFDTVTFPAQANCHHFPDRKAAASFLAIQAGQSCQFFVKGSRGNQLERLFEA